MLKNIIFDIGGILFDDSKENINKVLKENGERIYKKAYSGNFKKCLLGEMTVSDHIESLKNDMDYEQINYVLNKNNLNRSYPLLEKNFKYIASLKDQGYDLYLLSNITEESYSYVKDKIGIDKIFKGGIYSYQEHFMKPDMKIYELIIKKYKLKKEETIFFDDKEKKVIAANQFGIKSEKFASIQDIKKLINEKEKEASNEK